MVMHRSFSPLLACVLLILFGYGIGSVQVPTTVLAQTETLDAPCPGPHAATDSSQGGPPDCDTNSTAVDTPELTETPTAEAGSGWHLPTTHEHGDAPPAWVLASPQQPFTQTRELHVGYKGILGRT